MSSSGGWSGVTFGLHFGIMDDKFRRLRGIDLSRAHFEGAVIKASDLSQVILTGASCAAANFTRSKSAATDLVVLTYPAVTSKVRTCVGRTCVGGPAPCAADRCTFWPSPPIAGPPTLAVNGEGKSSGFVVRRGPLCDPGRAAGGAGDLVVVWWAWWALTHRTGSVTIRLEIDVKA